MNNKQLAAAGKILRRCTICKKFHAAYLVDIPEIGQCYLCYSCWKARHPEETSEKIDEQKKDSLENDSAA